MAFHVRMIRTLPVAATLCAISLAGCKGASPGSGAEDEVIEAAALTGVYAGVFPCGNCAGIDVRLWLRQDGVYFMRQDYPASAEAPADRVHGLGRWRWHASEGVLVLNGRGPERRFAYRAPDTLKMSTFSAEPHVLTRDQGAAPFTDRIRLDGEYVSAAGAESFHECVTGLRVTLRDDAGRRALRSRHRNISKAENLALATVEAHLVYAAQDSNGVLAVEELLSMRPRVRCADR